MMTPVKDSSSNNNISSLLVGAVPSAHRYRQRRHRPRRDLTPVPPPSEISPT
jgi:hypothetical protein